MGISGHSPYEKNPDNQSSSNNVTADNTFNKRNVIKKIKRALLIICAFIFIILFRQYLIDRVIVSGSSMNPTFKNGDVMWAKKYDKDYCRYQVVVASMGKMNVVKRIIGLPNEKIQIIDGYVYINEEKSDDKYNTQTEIYGCAENEITLGDDEYFLIGDNRNGSYDSREYGVIKESEIKGIIFFRIFPVNKIGKVN